MKKLLLLAMFVFVSSVANAATLKEGALYCVSSKKITSYYKFIENNYNDYAQQLMDRSDCFIKGKNEEVYVKSEQKKFVELQLLSGFTIWTKKENITR
jgi:hypothetical protein|tara:strand:- start:734 stop:1027 length:294 start_codon:yes stop_codon:yes gene_type:complete